ncbi:hypothetical protein PG997_007115 [Apiospora hydei]|uniref:Uncharacterized protein n=1 Tax=Apiospora hydei TaxID=1337664 RepID=A0ABR1WQN8_9PEZI
MELSTEAIIAIIGVVVTLPPTLLVTWKLLCRRRRRKRISGQSEAADDLDAPRPHNFIPIHSVANRSGELLDIPNSYGSRTAVAKGGNSTSVDVFIRVRTGSDVS